MGLLKNKVALVTGAGSGIGAATARLFAKEGARVMLADIDPRTGEERRKEIVEEGGTASFVRADVTLVEDVKAMFAAVEREFGGLDVLHNNAAGEPALGKIGDVEEEAWEQAIIGGVRPYYLGIRYGVPLLRRRGGGAIVNTASIAGLSAEHGLASHHAAKHAVIGITRAAAVDYASDKIRVNAVCPTSTGMRFLDHVPDDKKMIENAHPMGRTAEPEDQARVALFLASDLARFVTGVAIPVDGGLLAHSGILCTGTKGCRRPLPQCLHAPEELTPFIRKRTMTMRHDAMFRMMFLAALLTGFLQGAAAWAQEDSARSVRVFRPDDEGVREIIPGTFVKHMNGEKLTIALFRSDPAAATKADPVPIPPHTHGEEAILFLEGKGRWRILGKDYFVEAGDVVLLAAGVPHGGADADFEGRTTIIQVVTPTRPELGAEGATESPYGKVPVQEWKQVDGVEPVRIFKTNDEGMREVIPGIWIKHIYGKDLSIALFKMDQKEGSQPTPPHTHGEEAAVILKGGGPATMGGKKLDLRPGDVLLIPANLPHGGDDGSNRMSGETRVLSIITPPRDFGPEGSAENPYTKSAKP